MKYPARYVFGFFFCVVLLFFAGKAYAQAGEQDIVQTTTAGDEDNPYLQEQPLMPSPQPTKLQGKVLQAAATPAPTTNPSSPQLATFEPGEPNWQIDAEVTQVGRNAERARQFIYWVVTHPPIYHVPQIAQAWAFTRNVAYVLVVFVIVGLALQLVMSSRTIGQTFSGISLGMERVNLFSIVVRVVLIITFITFSYISVRLVIEGSEVMSRFFIERLGGQDLFNIIYSSANQDQNYGFVGYRNMDPLEQDMATTSLLLVRLTSFTYNFMGIIVILRQIILMFLLIVSPFLALLLPFIFIRNTGSIWIAEFFRWLFYGPLFALFLAALSKIWKAGIPYQFDFTRAQSGDMVYHTAINILYGGPAQTLTPTNTSNYVDTYAEYVIGLIMLWVAILLPWLLLKIFRDYCCDLIEKNSAILSQILDRMRNFTPPPPPPGITPGPRGTFGKKIDLPYRQMTSETRSTTHDITREKIIERIREHNVSNIETRDIQRAFDLKVSSLKDIARLETRKDSASMMKTTLDRISNPMKVSDSLDRQAFENLRSELTRRAAMGDQTAKSMIQAATYNVSKIENVTSNVANKELKEAIEKPGVPVILPGVRVATQPTVTPALTSEISQKTKVDAQKVEQVLKAIPLAGKGPVEEQIATIAEKVNIPKPDVKKVLDAIGESTKDKPTGPSPVTIEEYEEVRHMWMKHYQNSEVPISETIKSRDDWIKEDIQKLTNTINLLASPSVKDRQQGMENVAELLPFLLLGGFTDLETLSYIKAKLEAAKLVMEETQHIDKAKEEAKKEVEELVSIPVIEKQEDKTMNVAEDISMPLPDEKKDELPEFSEDQPEQTVEIPTIENKKENNTND